MVTNRLMLVMGCISLFRLVLVRFKLLRILVSWKISFFHTYENFYHDRSNKETKQLYSEFHSYINFSGVVHTHSRVSNNRTITIIDFLLKFSFYDAYPRPRDHQFCFLTPSACSFHSVQSSIFRFKRTLFEFSVNKQH